MFVFFFSSRRRHTRCALVTGVQTCALPILKHPIGRDRFAFSLNWAEFGPPPRRLISLQIETDLLPETFIPAIAAIPRELPFKSSRNGAGPSVGFEGTRSEEHTSELQSLMRISYAVFCLNKKQKNKTSK